MGARTTGAASAKRTPPAKKAKKKLSNPKPASNNKKISLGSRVDRLDEVMVMLATSKVETDAKMAASEEMLTRKMATSEKMLTRKIAAVAKTVKETSRELRQTMKELSESVDKTTKELSESVDKTMKELSESVDKTTKELSESVDKTTKDLSESVDKLNSNVGGINNSLGKVTELVLLPGLMETLNTQFGYQFDNISPNKIFTAGGKQYAEVDLFLENGEAVMAVEVKTWAIRDDVSKHVNRMGRLREHETKAGLTGKTIYAAIAGITFDDDARELARALGMYLVELDHSNALITIVSPTGAVGKW
ncbi:MAG: hypothetical protein LBB74_09215 [Chitinispirillales bacterium]|nr:hypothetical protein [Chitinispirillales bacterium]